MNLMGTTKILKTFLTTLLSITAVSASAQKDEWNELFKTNIQTEKDIQSLIADTTALHQAIDKFDAEQLRLNAQIDSVVNLYDEIKRAIDNKKISAIQHKIDSLNAVVKGLQIRKKELSSLYRLKETDLADLNRSIASMGVYSAIKDEQLYSRYQEILSKPFSAITIDNLREIESELNSFSTLPDFNEFKAQLVSCIKNKKLYDAAEDFLRLKYDANKIDKTRDELYELLDINENDFSKGIIKLSDAQYSEIDTLDIKLSRYGDGISVLMGIVKAVNESKIREQNQGSKEACIDAMRSIVVSEAIEDVEKRKRYFDMIPSLNNLYLKYWEELQADPFTYPTATENIIMQLNNE